MPARPARLTQTEVTRVVRGVEAGGIPVACVEVNPLTGAVRCYREGAAPVAFPLPGLDEDEAVRRCREAFGG